MFDYVICFNNFILSLFKAIYGRCEFTFLNFIYKLFFSKLFYMLFFKTSDS